MCIYCSIIGYIGENFWTISQTVVGIFAIYYAYTIVQEQIRLSNEQGKIIEKQNEMIAELLNITRYTVHNGSNNSSNNLKRD